ncbi:MAG: threonine--tRNA ligase [Planctomycetota bacterium]
MIADKIILTFPDGSKHDFKAGVTGAEVAASIGRRLAADALAVKLDGQLQDLGLSINKSSAFAVVTPKTRNGQVDSDGLWLIRHTAEHVTTEAICRLWPKTKLVYGPPVENGYYADFDLDYKISVDDFPKIEAEMTKIIAENKPLTRYVLPKSEAFKKLEAEGNEYKLENARHAEGDDISFYVTGKEVGREFEDLCGGPHLPCTGKIGAFKLTSVAGAYYHGDESQKQLQRVYGVAFATKPELDAWLAMQEEQKKRDHRKLGSELAIFTFDEDVGPGLPLWLPNGGAMIEELEKLARDTEFQAGYQRVRTPHITKGKLYETSGHLELYRDKMFPPMKFDDVEYYLKPMNCPHHHKIFAAQQRSYRDLPLRLAEYGTCYRYEQSGELFGLMRVRSMQMNDAHIYCGLKQFEQEFLAVCEMYLSYFKIFGIDKYEMRFSTHGREGLGKKYVNEPDLWTRTEDMVRSALRHGNIPFVETQDEAAFYGPKIDVEVWSAIGREFTLATNQVDFAVPKRFGLTFKNFDNREETPLCIHRAPLGTHERFIGFLIEHYAGLFPLWLSPVQMRVANIGDETQEASHQLLRQLRTRNFRADADVGPGGNIKAKVKDFEEAKIPYLLIIGPREAAGNQVAVRGRGRNDLGVMAIEEFIARATQEVAERKNLSPK